MAVPMTADEMVAALWNEGLSPMECGGWRTHNRNHKGPWGPVHGVVIHHTAGVGSGLLNYVYDGSADLPGPLCHAYLNKAGGLYLVGNGRANHAGTFASNAHVAVLQESSRHPEPTASEIIDGNRYYYGIEIENKGDGSDPYPAVQYNRAVLWAAAICRHHGWSANSVIGHKEGTLRKVDPSFDMNTFRRDVDRALSVTSTPPQHTEADRMHYTSLARTISRTIQPKTSYRVYWDAEYTDDPDDHADGGKPFLTASQYTGTVSVYFAEPLPIGVSVRMVREKSDGTSSGEPLTDLVAGSRKHSVSVSGVVPIGRRLAFEISNDSDAPVTVQWAGIRLFSQSL